MRWYCPIKRVGSEETMTNVQTTPDVKDSNFRWLQLAMGIVCMAMIANFQYGWTLFVDPIDAKYHWGRPAIQMAFTIFVLTETWLVPVEAWFVDRFGPQVVVMFGGVMIALSWVLNSYADSLVWLYAAAMVGGIGAGSIYGTCVGNALKWFPDRRGLAAGATAAGFGAGAALTVVPIAHMVAASGYQTAFLDFGIGQGLIVFVLAFFLRKPSQVMPASKKQLNLPQTRIDFTPSEVLRTPIFWVLYLVFVMVAAGGLMTAAQIGPIAHDFKIADTSVSLLGFQMAALTFAISLDRIFDGFGVRSSAGSPTPSAANTPCSSPSGLPPSWCWCCRYMGTTQSCSCWRRRSISVCSAKSTACFRRPAATPSASNMRRRTAACCTPPRERPPCWCRSPA